MKFSRIFALFLSALLLFSLLGCEKIDLSGGKDDAGNQHTGATDSSDPNTLTVKTIVSGNETFRPEGGASPKTDRILAQIETVEKETGTTVNVELVSKTNLSEQFLRACRTGKKYADVIQTDAMFLSRYYDEGYILSLPDVGLEASKTGSLKKSDGTAYALRADGWNNPLPTLSYLLFYNERILTDRNCETPLELYEDGAWNWINFERLCNQVTDGEVYALAYPNESNTDLVWATLHAAGLTYFSDDGTCIMDSQQGLTGFSELQSLLTSGVTYALGAYENSTADPTAKLAFTNRHTAFLVGNSSLLFETGDDSLSACLKEDLRIIGFPSIQKGTTGACFSSEDIFCGVTSRANKELCKTLLPLLFALPEGVDIKEETTEDYFYHEKDATLYFDLLSTADTDTSLPMTDNRWIVEEYFVQIAKGQLSAKEYLNNLQSRFNANNAIQKGN